MRSLLPDDAHGGHREQQPGMVEQVPAMRVDAVQPPRSLAAAAWLIASCLVLAGTAHAASPGDVCAVAKLKAVGRKASSKLGCYASAIRRGRAVDLGCLARAEAKFAASFAKAEAKGGCNVAGDADAVEQDVDTCASTIVADEPGEPESQLTPIAARSWTVPAGVEEFRCRRIQLQNDLYITGFRSVSPPGVFGVRLSVSSTSSPLGDYNCTPGDTDQHLIFASGTGTTEVSFPPGVGVHLHAGDYLNMNIHLANDSKRDADDTSGVLVRTGSAADVVNDPELLLAGTFDISIPGDGMPHTATGGCTWPADAHVVGLWPRLLTTGTHVKLVRTVLNAQTSDTLLDVPYTIDDEPVYPVSVELNQADSLQVTCTYVNNTGNTLVYGESVDAEQCFVGMYVYGLDPPVSWDTCTSS